MKKLKQVLIVLALVFLFFYLVFLILDKSYPIDIETKILEDTSPVLLFSNMHWAYVKTNKEDKWRLPLTLSQIDPSFIQLLLSYEDHRFYSHYGVDPLAMFRALGQWLRFGHIVSGGSTITMQLAKLLHPRPRTLSAKLIEMFRAVQLEQYYSKDKILEAYLTLAPYGGNIEGIMASSLRYFNKKPYALDASQMALLVALPQSPERNRPDRNAKQSTKSRDKILGYALHKNIISAYEYEEALKVKVPKSLYPMPRHSGHIAQKHLKTDKLKTTLNENLQIQLEKWALSKERELAKESTLAVLVIRNKDASVQAYLGSHDRFSPRVSGYVDMITAIRSPASTLKPFIYTQGFEAYIIHPHSIILDEKTRFGDYIPHNFSEEYTGEVSIDYALQHSLNIPAVKVLERIGVHPFVNHINTYLLGKLFIPKNKATLPIALGGLGLSMWKLSQLYVALANEGQSRPLHYLKKNKKNTLTRLYSKASSQMTTNILRQIQAPKGFTDRKQHIAYKTGTSYGYRDAWTLAYSKEYTVAIWVGKPSNAIQIQRTGSNTSAPLAFEVFSYIEALLYPKHWTDSAYTKNTVPLSLKYFDKNKKETEKKFAFVFPQKNSRFISAGCKDAIIEILLKEGNPPYYWYIDNELKDYNYQEESLYLPFKHGGHSIQVIDSVGAIITREFWVDKPFKCKGSRNDT
ncbi:Multimodular transpeptidase-transglycosylase [hydrothermal vent metagenome]|uniref:peptidoglycan glycosyltransferase n=1 Tax=hydrothermal vent metagenome TaxID=652676 RepID=A0A1W1C8C9_9ZZZZ